MNIISNPRLRAPVAGLIIGAGAVAAAVAGGGGNWKTRIILAVVVIAGPIVYYVWGGRDSDMGALIRSQPDERQNLLRMRAQAFTARIMTVAAVAGTLVAVALRGPVWPFALFVGIATVSSIIGLLIYRDRGPRDSEPPV